MLQAWDDARGWGGAAWGGVLQPAARLAPQLVGAATRLVLEAARLHEGEPPAPAAGAHAQAARAPPRPARGAPPLPPAARATSRPRPPSRARGVRAPPRPAAAARRARPASWRRAAARSLSSPPRIVWRRRSLCAHTATTASWQDRPARRRRSRHPQRPSTVACSARCACLTAHSSRQRACCTCGQRAEAGGGSGWWAHQSVGAVGKRRASGLYGVHATARSGVRTEEMEFDATHAS